MKVLNLLATSCLTAVCALTASAEWILIEDFENAVYEDFNLWKRYAPQGDLFLEALDPTNLANGHYFADPGPQTDGQNNQIHNGFTLPAPIPEGGKGTLKYRVYFYESGPFNLNIGLSDTPVVIDPELSKENGQMIAPTTYGDFESQVGWTDLGIITVRNGNGFSNTVVPIPVGEWVTVYYLVDNGRDITQFYYKLDSMEAPAIIEMVDGTTDVLFRNGTTDPLVTLNVISAGSNSGQVSVFLLDDIYYDPTGFNLDGTIVDPGDPVWAGFDIVNEAGDANTGDWLGWINASEDPWIYVYNVQNFFAIQESDVSPSGAWAYIPYTGTAWEAFEIGSDGLVNTGTFLNWLYVPGGDWVFSYTFERWLYMPQPAPGAGGAWAYIPEAPEPPVPADYPLPSLVAEPFIDGILAEGEWAGAIMAEHRYSALVPTGIGTSKLDIDAGSPQPDAPRASAEVYMGTTAQGLYVGFNVTDDQITTTHQLGQAGNGSDGVQLGIDLNPNPSDRTSTVLLDINPTSLVDGQPTGPTNVFPRWAADGYPMQTWGVRASSEIVEGGYTIEVMVPWVMLGSFGVDNPLTQGSDFRLTVVLLDQDAGVGNDTFEILWDAGAGVLGIGSAANWPTAAISAPLTKTAAKYSVPIVDVAPTIDGTVSEGEWALAEYTEASYDNWVARSAGVSRNIDPEASRAEGGIFLMATDEALYMGAVITDPFVRITTPFATGSNNEDGVQMAIDMNPNPGNRDTSVLWDFTAATVADGTLSGPANIFGRWGIVPGYDAAWGIQAAGSLTDTGYIIEVKMPWQVMQDLGYVNPLEAGSPFTLSFIVVNVLEDGTVDELLVDFGNGAFTIGDSSTWNEAVIDD